LSQSPLLRTPPFPHADRKRAAVSVTAERTSGEVDPARADRLFALIREARVGGCFWDEANDPWSLPSDATIRTAGDDERIAIGAFRGMTVRVTAPGRFGSPGSGPDPLAIARHLLIATRYRNPFDGRAIEVEQAVALLAEWRRQIDANRGITVAMGMAWWKRREIATFLWSGCQGIPRFIRNDAVACGIAKRTNGAIAVWPSRISSALTQRAAGQSSPIVRVEDGFIRSVGLGSALHPPYSVTVDRLGMHYDPAQPSELEGMLETANFPPALLARAEALRRLIVERGVGKYGGRLGAALPQRQPGRRLVLVTGQVSDDLSVLSGGGDVEGNADLLARARALEPDAEIWFRPHPDVDAGHRRGAIPDAEALRHADRVIREGSMAELLERVDGIHVLTSLSGFEALLRGRDVTTHGTPFYAGWGLTRDLAPPVARRSRRLTLDQLAAATLILYPRYLDPVTGLPCPVETLVARFGQQMRPRQRWLIHLRSIQGRLIRNRT
jgi:capsular polysaccharide export protein